MNEYVDIIVNAVPDYVDVVVDRLPDYVEVINEQVIERVVQDPPFTKTLSGFTDTIDQDEHSLSVVRGLRVCNSVGEEIEVKETYNGTTVNIESSLPLDGFTITIY